MTYKSIVTWPADAGLRLGNTANESHDTHPTHEAALAVCYMLQREGFGGERIVFPVNSYVIPVLGIGFKVYWDEQSPGCTPTINEGRVVSFDNDFACVRHFDRLRELQLDFIPMTDLLLEKR